MNRMLLAVLPFITGCLGLDARFADARMEWAEAVGAQAAEQKAASAELAEVVTKSSAELAAGLKTAKEHTETVEDAGEELAQDVGESLARLEESLKATWDDLESGVRDDVESATSVAKDVRNGVLGGGLLWDLAATALAAVLGSNAVRNRNLPGTIRLPPKNPPAA